MEGKDARALRRFFRAAMSPRSDAFTTVDVRIARLMASAIWALGTAFTVVLLPLAPPTEAIGTIGWVPAALAIVLGAVMARWRSDDARPVSLDSLWRTPYVGIGLVILLEWLAGGREAPYHYLYLLPVLYAAAIHSIGRFGVFLAVAAAGSSISLLYEPDLQVTAADVVGQILLLLVLAVATRLLITMFRLQRTELRESREEAERLSRLDSLTGLGNRRAFEEALESAVARAQRSGEPLSVAMGDIVGFKAVNDELGHVAGDHLLRLVGDSLAASARAGDECFRWGGDEFVVLLPATTQDEAAVVSERLGQAIAQACQLPDGRRLAMHWGVAETADGLLAPEDLLAGADRGLVGGKADEAADGDGDRRARAWGDAARDRPRGDPAPS